MATRRGQSAREPRRCAGRRASLMFVALVTIIFRALVIFSTVSATWLIVSHLSMAILSTASQNSA